MPIDYIKYRTKDVYLWEDNEQAFVRYDHNTRHWFAKFPGGNEYRVNQDTDIVTRAMYADQEVTKQQYDLGNVIFQTYPKLPQRKF